MSFRHPQLLEMLAWRRKHVWKTAPLRIGDRTFTLGDKDLHTAPIGGLFA
jgi:hypothetical protein